MKLNRQLDDGENIAQQAFAGIKPFTITINNGDDAMFLALALMVEMCGDRTIANLAMRTCIHRAKEVGIEPAVNEMFDMAKQAELEYPEFLKPVLNLMITHMFDNKDRIAELIKKHDKEDNTTDQPPT